MRNVKLNNKHSSDAISLTGRRRLPQKKSERIFLDDQAAYAKNAMSRTLQNMKKTLKGMVDVRAHVRKHPWVAVGSAIAAGFITGAVLTKTNSEAEPQPSDREQHAPQTKKSFLFATVGTILASILRTVIQSSIASAVATKEQPRVETPPSSDAMGAVAPETGTE